MQDQSLLVLGSAQDNLLLIPDNTIDLIVTSPPYANQRKATYGGIKNEDYVEWFLPISAELLRVIKPTGTFILNIKENVIEGERSTYVMELVIAMKKQGWLWTEEYIWHKKNTSPGKWPNRFRDTWEHLYQFNKDRKFAMYQDEVMVPVGDWAIPRFAKGGSERDHRRIDSDVGSGFGHKRANWIGRDKVYPANVLHLASETGNKGHSAVFPESIPEWFIKCFSKEGDTILDPFAGSGTTLVVANRLNRESIGFELSEVEFERANQRIDSALVVKQNSPRILGEE